MNPTPPHLKVLEEIEREGIPGLVEVLHKEGLEAVRYALWDATGRPEPPSPAAHSSSSRSRLSYPYRYVRKSPRYPWTS